MDSVKQLLSRAPPLFKVEHVLRLLALTRDRPKHLLSQTGQSLADAYAARTYVSWPPYAKKLVKVAMGLQLANELHAVAVSPWATLSKDANLASWISSSDRTDGNGAAQTLLRRAWRKWCEQRGDRGKAQLLDLSRW